MSFMIERTIKVPFVSIPKGVHRTKNGVKIHEKAQNIENASTK